MSKTIIESVYQSYPGEGSFLTFIAMRRDKRVIGTVTGNEIISVIGDPAAKPAQSLRTVQFSRLFVLPQFRKLGVGRLLLKALEERAKQAVSVSCYVKPHNKGAIQFYKRCGYRVSFVYSDGDLCMTKFLRPKKEKV